jgi:hypothetical protein
MGSVSEGITHALVWDGWHRLDGQTHDQRLELCHDGMAKRWLVGYFQAV